MYLQCWSWLWWFMTWLGWAITHKKLPCSLPISPVMGVSPLPSLLSRPPQPQHPDVTHTHPDPSSDKGDVQEARHNAAMAGESTVLKCKKGCYIRYDTEARIFLSDICSSPKSNSIALYVSPPRPGSNCWYEPLHCLVPCLHCPSAEEMCYR